MAFQLAVLATKFVFEGASSVVKTIAGIQDSTTGVQTALQGMQGAGAQLNAALAPANQSLQMINANIFNMTTGLLDAGGILQKTLSFATFGGLIAGLTDVVRNFFSVQDSITMLGARFKSMNMDVESSVASFRNFTGVLADTASITRSAASALLMTSLQRGPDPSRYQEVALAATAIAAKTGMSAEMMLRMVNFGEENYKSYNRLLRLAGAQVSTHATQAEVMKAVNKIVQEGAEIQATQQTTFAAGITRLQNAMGILRNTISLAIGPGFADAVRGSVAAVTDILRSIAAWVKNNQELISTVASIVGRIVTGIGVFLTFGLVAKTVLMVFQNFQGASLLVAAGVNMVRLAFSILYPIIGAVGFVLGMVNIVTGALSTAFGFLFSQTMLVRIGFVLYHAAIGAAYIAKYLFIGAVIAFIVVANIALGVLNLMRGAYFIVTTAVYGAVAAIGVLGYIITLGQAVNVGYYMSLFWTNFWTIACNVATASWNAILIVSQVTVLAFQGAVLLLRGAIMAARVAIGLFSMALKAALVASVFGGIIVLVGALLEASGIIDILTDSTKTWGEKFQEILGPIGGVLIPIWDTLRIKFAGAWEAIKSGWDTLVVAFWDGVHQIRAAFGFSGASIVNWGAVWDSVVGFVSDLWELFLDELSVVGLRIQQFCLMVTIGFKSIPAVISFLIDYFAAFAGWFINNFVTIISEGLNILGNLFMAFAKAVAETGRQIWRAIKGEGFDFSAIGAKFTEEFEKIKASAKRMTSDLYLPEISQYTSGVAKAEKDALKGVTDAIEKTKEENAWKRMWAEFDKDMELEDAKTKKKDDAAKKLAAAHPTLYGKDINQQKGWSDLMSSWKKLQEKAADASMDPVLDTAKKHLEKTEETNKLLTRTATAVEKMSAAPAAPVVPI